MAVIRADQKPYNSILPSGAVDLRGSVSDFKENEGQRPFEYDLGRAGDNGKSVSDYEDDVTESAWVKRGDQYPSIDHRGDHLRQLALAEANRDPSQTNQNIVDRAKAFYAFLSGDEKAAE